MVIAGTPDTILREINKYVDIGVTYFTIYFPDLPNMISLQLLLNNLIIINKLDYYKSFQVLFHPYRIIEDVNAAFDPKPLC